MEIFRDQVNIYCTGLRKRRRCKICVLPAMALLVHTKYLPASSEVCCIEWFRIMQPVTNLFLLQHCSLFTALALTCCCNLIAFHRSTNWRNDGSIFNFKNLIHHLKKSWTKSLLSILCSSGNNNNSSYFVCHTSNSMFFLALLSFSLLFALELNTALQHYFFV